MAVFERGWAKVVAVPRPFQCPCGMATPWTGPSGFRPTPGLFNTPKEQGLSGQSCSALRSGPPGASAGLTAQGVASRDMTAEPPPGPELGLYLEESSR